MIIYSVIESETFGWTHVRGHEQAGKNDIFKSNNLASVLHLFSCISTRLILFKWQDQQ